MKTPAPQVQIHLLIVLLAFTAILGKIITLPVPALVFWRTIIAAAGMFVLLILTRPALLKLPDRKQIPLILAAGAVIGLHWICFFGAILLSNVSVALSAMASISLFTAFTEAWHEKRAPHRHEIILGLVVFAGLIIIVGVEFHYLAGLLVGLVGTFLAAIFPVWNRALVRQGLPARTLLLYEMSAANLAIVVCLALIPGSHFQFAWPTTRDWLPLLVLALVCTTFGHTWHSNILKHLSAYTSNLAVNFEPLYGMILAAIIFKEYQNLSLGFYCGAALVIIANFYEPMLMRRKRLRKIIP